MRPVSKKVMCTNIISVSYTYIKNVFEAQYKWGQGRQNDEYVNDNVGQQLRNDNSTPSRDYSQKLSIDMIGLTRPGGVSIYRLMDGETTIAATIGQSQHRWALNSYALGGNTRRTGHGRKFIERGSVRN